jgi:8-hydroxy-5-deazaflavin:NADPH oxidoreductase
VQVFFRRFQKMRNTLALLTILVVLPTVLVGQQPSIAVIGTGNMGGSLGPRLAEAGYTVIYGSREPARCDVQELVASTGHGASAASQEEAAAQGDIVVLAVHWEVVEGVLSELGDLSGKVLVDISGPNRLAPDGYMEVSVETSGGEIIQAWRPEARVVKAAMPSAYLIEAPTALGMSPTVMLAADDREAKETVGRMLADIGLDPWDAGPLRMSRAIEALGLLFWVPLLQGREQGAEFLLLRSSFWPCVWDVQEEFGTPADAEDLAQLPVPAPPRPCESWSR